MMILFTNKSKKIRINLIYIYQLNLKKVLSNAM